MICKMNRYAKKAADSRFQTVASNIRFCQYHELCIGLWISSVLCRGSLETQAVHNQLINEIKY